MNLNSNSNSNYNSGEVRIPKRILSSIIASVSAGVVPRMGAPYIAIGREDEVQSLLNDLENIAEGGACMRFIIGKYGSGKSFLMQLIRGYALDRGFVTADADLSPERRFCGSKGMGRATYREMMKNLATKSSPDGSALSGVMTKFFSLLRSQVASDGISPDDKAFDKEVEKRLFSLTSTLQGQIGGFDFSYILMKLYRAELDGDEMVRGECMRWLRAEYTTKTEARKSIGVGNIIDDDNWYDYIKLFAVFFRRIGYSGFVVFIDECVNLYKISNRISRENNYEKILSMFNDTLQCKAEGLELILGGTPQFLEDPRRGLYSYEALRSRLFDGYFDSGKYKNLIGPLIRLRRLSDSELYALILRITRLHAQYYNAPSRITQEEMKLFLQKCLSRAGADSLITPREMIRDYISLLNVLMQNPQVSTSELIQGGEYTQNGSVAEGTANASETDISLEDIDI